MDVTSQSQNAIPGPSSVPIPIGHGRIIRDEAGNVLRIELAEGEAEQQHRKEDKDMDMEELEPEVDNLVWDKWVTELGGGEKGNGVGGKGNVVSGEQISYGFSLFFFRFHGFPLPVLPPSILEFAHRSQEVPSKIVHVDYTVI